MTYSREHVWSLALPAFLLLRPGRTCSNSNMSTPPSLLRGTSPRRPSPVGPVGRLLAVLAWLMTNGRSDKVSTVIRKDSRKSLGPVFLIPGTHPLGTGTSRPTLLS